MISTVDLKQEILNTEKWMCLASIGFPNNYVCNDGRIMTTNRRGHGIYALLDPVPDKDGYITYNLNYNGKKKNVKAHRIVAQLFVPGYDPKLQVNHIDGDITNNNYTNLEWVTNRQNSLHRVFNPQYKTEGLKTEKQIDRSGSPIEEKHLVIKELYENGYSQAEICRMLGLSATYVHKIVRNKY